MKGLNPSRPVTAERARELMSMSQESFEESLSVVRQMCDHDIEEAAQRHRSSIAFAVPQSLFGREAYDVSKMGKRLALQLHADGYDIVGSSKSFRITWGADAVTVPQIPRAPLVQFTGGPIFKRHPQ